MTAGSGCFDFFLSPLSPSLSFSMLRTLLHSRCSSFFRLHSTLHYTHQGTMAKVSCPSLSHWETKFTELAGVVALSSHWRVPLSLSLYSHASVVSFPPISLLEPTTDTFTAMKPLQCICFVRPRCSKVQVLSSISFLLSRLFSSMV